MEAFEVIAIGLLIAYYITVFIQLVHENDETRFHYYGDLKRYNTRMDLFIDIIIPFWMWIAVVFNKIENAYKKLK